jgi:hypothetical protein
MDGSFRHAAKSKTQDTIEVRIGASYGTKCQVRHLYRKQLGIISRGLGHICHVTYSMFFGVATPVYDWIIVARGFQESDHWRDFIASFCKR